MCHPLNARIVPFFYVFPFLCVWQHCIESNEKRNSDSYEQINRNAQCTYTYIRVRIYCYRLVWAQCILYVYTNFIYAIWADDTKYNPFVMLFLLIYFWSCQFLLCMLYSLQQDPPLVILAGIRLKSFVLNFAMGASYVNIVVKHTITQQIQLKYPAEGFLFANISSRLQQ